MYYLLAHESHIAIARFLVDMLRLKINECAENISRPVREMVYSICTHSVTYLYVCVEIMFCVMIICGYLNNTLSSYNALC